MHKTRRESALRVLIEKLQEKLPEFLAQHDLHPTDRDFITCISRYHPGENTPSMHMIPGTNNTRLKCFGACGVTMDILTAAHHLEGLPIDGADFIQGNVFILAERFGIPHEGVEISEEEAERYREQSLLTDTAEVFAEVMDFRYAERRGWTEDFCRAAEIGTVGDLSSFYQKVMERGGWDKESMVKAGVYWDGPRRISRLFGPDRLTFLLRNERRRPVGFAARNYHPTRPDPKWINTTEWNPLPGREAGSRLYQKDRYLYGFASAVEAFRRGEGRRLDIYEGYADVASARTKGHNLSVACCGTSFTDGHIGMIREAGIAHVNLVLDGDRAGSENMMKYLSSCTGIQGLKVTVGFLPWPNEIPEKERDPDTWFRYYNLEDYNRCLKIYDAFDWELERLAQGEFIAEDVASVMIDFLQNEENVILRGKKMEKLGNITGIPVRDIEAEFTRRFNSTIDRVVEDTVHRLNRARDTKERVSILQAASDTIQRRTSDDGIEIDQGEVVANFQEFMARQNRPSDEIAGWDCGYPLLNMAMDGLPKTDIFLGFGGHPNSGKSALGLNIIMNLVRNYDNVEVTGCIFALDDPRNTVWAKILAIITGFPINHCARPHDWILSDPVRHEVYVSACREVSTLLAENRLSVKGVKLGATVPTLERWVEHVQKVAGRSPVVLVDSMFNIRIPGIDDPNQRQEELSAWFHQKTESMGFTAITTLECNKAGIRERRPRLSDVHGSRKLQYDLNFAGMLQNEVNTLREEAKVYWTDGGQRRPVIEMLVDKNKLGAFKQSIFYKFEDDTGRLIEIPMTQTSDIFHNGGFDISGPTPMGPTTLAEIFAPQFEMTGAA